MTFSDIFKSSFLENVTAVSLTDMALALVLSFCLGLFIYFIYKKTYAGVMFSRAFGGALIAMTMITAMVILAVTSNVVLSLGMVGALSIVRFRSAIKEPMDIMFMFWAVAAGIAAGAGMAGVAVVGSLMIGLMIVLLTRGRQNGVPYILVLQVEGQQAEEAAMKLVAEKVRRSRIKSKRVGPEGAEVTVDIRLKGGDTAFLHEINALPGVRSAMLVTYNGEYMV